MSRFVRISWLLCAFLVSIFFGGCSQPEDSKRIDGPGNGVTYVVETTFGAGAATADYTKVFARSLGKKEGTGVLVLSGENLDIRKIFWMDASNVEICLMGGITDHYANQVMVGEAGGMVKVRNHLVESC